MNSSYFEYCTTESAELIVEPAAPFGNQGAVYELLFYLPLTLRQSSISMSRMTYY
jgi:hypothetical protein